MKTLSGTSLTSEMGCDKQMMDETFAFDFDLKKQKEMLELHIVSNILELIKRLSTLYA